jgi:ATP-binding cassette subfamily F protein 3
MESCDSLIAALDRFDGAVIVATHNEMMLHALANRIVVLDRGKVSVFEGTYEEFLEQVGWEGEEDEKAEAKKADEGQIVNKKDLRRARSEIITRRYKETKHLETRMKRIEAEIMAKETEHRAAQDGIVEASTSGDGKRIAEYSKEFHRLTGEIEALYAELETVTNEFEAISAKYEKELEGWSRALTHCSLSTSGEGRSSKRVRTSASSRDGGDREWSERKDRTPHRV